MRRLLIGCVVASLMAVQALSEDFITKMEYAKMLYSNPRGIGCNKCHGEKGEGSVIAQYIQKNKHVSLTAPNITNVPKERFFQALTSQHRVMPTYFLTWQEIDSLYYYVSSEVKK